MTTDKKSTSFKLSPQAHANLNAITEAAGCTKTAAVEIGIALLMNFLNAGEDYRRIITLMLQDYSRQHRGN